MGLSMFKEWYATGKQRAGEKGPAAAAGTMDCKDRASRTGSLTHTGKVVIIPQ